MGSAVLKKWRISAFDEVVEKFSQSQVSFTEEEALKSNFWDMGEEARLREDFRFRKTPGGRWMLSERLLANDALYKLFHRKEKSSIALAEAISELGTPGNKSWVFCKADKRFVLEDGYLRLAENELSKKMLTEEASDFEKYKTHLPVHTLEAVAASEPAGEWGPHSQEEMVETLGWVKVTLPGRKLNDRMFVARIKGNSMDDGKSGLMDGSYAVFELWPEGTRQNKIVLVQGSFNDLETGSYALKKYVADTRDKEGVHHRVSLVSLNPDKENYPDILLDPEDDASIRVVAQLIAGLSHRQYARQPKPVKAPRRRNLNPDHVAGQMRQRLSDIFEKPIETAGGDLKKDIPMQLVCLDFEAGGLHVETDPQSWLPNFVKKVVLQSDVSSCNVLGANLRNLRWRQMVEPSTKGYSWTAPGFEEDLEDEFSKLQIAGLSDSAVTIFKVDASGVGRQINNTTLTPGQVYRIVLPPTLAFQNFPIGTFNYLDHGWQLWEVSIPVEIAGNVSEILQKLGLTLGKATPCLDWVITSPVDYNYTPRGEAIPCFRSGKPLYVSIKGISTVLPEEVYVFVMNNGKTTTFPLPPGAEWWFSLEELSPGRGLVLVLPKKTTTGRAELPFYIVDKEPVPLSAAISVVIKGEKRMPDSEGDIYFSDNLQYLDSENFDFNVAAPPMWPVTAKWQGVEEIYYPIQHCELAGDYDTDALLNYSKNQRDFPAPGNLTINFSELGRLLLQHDPVPDPDAIQERFLDIFETTKSSLPGLKGQFQLLRQIWLDPILQSMGFIIGELNTEDLANAPDGTTALLLSATCRKNRKQEIECKKDRIVVIVNDPGEIPKTGKGSFRRYADDLCYRYGVQVALITDGEHWMRHRINSKLKAKIYNLHEILQGKDNREDFEHFLSDIGGL